MKITRLFILFITLCSLTTIANAQHDVVVDEVVAVVGKNIIKLSDVENAYSSIRRQQGYTNAKENRCQILESILLNKLLVHKGEVDSVEVTDDEVEQQVQYYLKNYIRQYGSKEAMFKATGYTYEDLHDIYFRLLKDRIISQRVEGSLTDNVKITPREVAEYYNAIPKDSIPMISDEYEFAEIEIRPSITEAERERVRFELSQMRERILKGEKFSMLATLYSEDPGSAKKGGELGFFTRGEMVSEFEAAAYALKPGEVSPIIETKFGFHIIQLIERRGNSVNARHILITPKASAEDLLKVRMKLDSIATEIRLGNITFEDAAKQYSEGATKLQGGVMTNPYTGNNRFGKEMFKELYSTIPFTNMKVGDISNATVKTTDDNKEAYHIVKLTKKVEAHQANLSDDYDKIYNATLEKAKQDKIQAWAQKMIKNTYIRISDDFKDCNFQLNWTK